MIPIQFCHHLVAIALARFRPGTVGAMIGNGCAVVFMTACKVAGMEDSTPSLSPICRAQLAAGAHRFVLSGADPFARPLSILIRGTQLASTKRQLYRHHSYTEFI